MADQKALQAKADQAQQLETEMKRKQEDGKKALDRRIQELTGPVYQDIGSALQAYAKARGRASSMGPKIIILVALLAALPVGGTQKASYKASKFFNGFALDEAVRKNESRWGKLCSAGGEGGGGGGATGGGLREARFNKTQTFSCRVSTEGGDKFDEGAFLESLRLDIRKEISNKGARVMRGGSLGPAGFYFEYRVREYSNIRGRVEVTGQSSGAGHYSLSAKLNEVARR